LIGKERRKKVKSSSAKPEIFNPVARQQKQTPFRYNYAAAATTSNIEQVEESGRRKERKNYYFCC
jgi:hypothetical protein